MTVEDHVFDGAEDAADKIDATVAVEILVFDGNCCLTHGERNV